MHIEASPFGWKIRVEGGGVQPFAGHTFTRWDMARRALHSWIEEQA